MARTDPQRYILEVRLSRDTHVCRKDTRKRPTAASQMSRGKVRFQKCRHWATDFRFQDVVRISMGHRFRKDIHDHHSGDNKGHTNDRRKIRDLLEHDGSDDGYQDNS